MRLRIHPERCTGCRICETFCSFHHERVVWPERARVTVVAESDSGPFRPNICRQCNARDGSQGRLAPCAEACPEDAIALDPATGAWVIDRETCTGCGACAEACPFDAVFVDPTRGTAVKCDLCGGAPECAAMCPSGAVTVEGGS
jgi:Fe-S-cluster-containing hydrogenase component 2